MIINTQQGKGNGSGDFRLLDTDVYRMKIASATLEEDQFAEPNADGARPVKLVLRWEVTEASDDQDSEVEGCAVWQRLNPYYGTVREGGPSKFKAFIDALREQGLLDAFDPSAFDTDDLEGIEQRVSIEKYLKTMGANAGKPGNKVVGVLPIKRAKPAKPARNTPVTAGHGVDVEDLPF